MAEEARDPRGVSSSTHWETVWASHGREKVDWYEESPDTSTELVLSAGVPGSVIDVGAGASTLADALLEAGVEQLTLLDLSLSALALAAVRLDEHGHAVTTIVADVLTHAFDEQYDVWHDRAVFHFLVEPEQRAAYVAQVGRALAPGGRLVVGAFAEDGPETSAGLPVTRYDADALAAEFGADFTPETTRRSEHHTPWDSVQPFTWVVLRRTRGRGSPGWGPGAAAPVGF